jgi:hypothetical protein
MFDIADNERQKFPALEVNSEIFHAGVVDTWCPPSTQIPQHVTRHQLVGHGALLRSHCAFLCRAELLDCERVHMSDVWELL